MMDVRATGWLIVIAALLAGCASVPTTPQPQGAAPIDLSMDVAIVPAPDDAELTAMLPGGGGRFTLDPDGMLRYGSLKPANADWSPGASRLLSRDELADVWLRLRQRGYADPAQADAFASESDAPGMCTLDLAGWDTRWRFHQPLGVAHANDAAMLELVEHLAGLLNLDPVRQTRLVIPRRYDFGPDPYAQYR